ncbi:MAG: PD40 domain-containing protein [Bacteroidetes bacterium]|nr:PD40 domain-containing protein [Bacteroidota bacterium]
MKTKFFFYIFISLSLIFSNAIANKINNCNQLLPNTKPSIENPQLLLAKNSTKGSSKLDSNLSEKLVYVSIDNSYFIFESHHPKEKQTLSSDLVVASQVLSDKTTFQIEYFEIFNTKENANLKLNGNKKEHFYTCLKESNKMDIYDSYFNGNNWSTPQIMNSNINSKYNETSACLSPDGKTLYFTSDRKGGYGGLDIWKSELLDNGEWGPVNNLGPTVNTASDEESPYVLADNVTMYFSSKGHNSTGGFDVFYSTQTDDGYWSNAINAGITINTKEDELHFKISTDEKYAFYSKANASSNKNYKIIKTQFDPNSVSMR